MSDGSVTGATAGLPTRSRPGPGRRRFSEVPQRIHGRAVDPDLEVQVWAEAVPRAAHVADHVALAYALAAADRDRRLVAVGGRDPAPVVDRDEVAVAAHPAAVDDGS